MPMLQDYLKQRREFRQMTLEREGRIGRCKLWMRKKREELNLLTHSSEKSTKYFWSYSIYGRDSGVSLALLMRMM